ncbi:MAG: transposase [Alphaproteobacteria bacterium]|nr:transposase [Alphaproteobacteria bacterium]
MKLHLEEGRTIRQVSEKLGIPSATFNGWVESYKDDGKEAFPGKGHLKTSDAEMAQLRKELAIAPEERDILKTT